MKQPSGSCIDLVVGNAALDAYLTKTTHVISGENIVIKENDTEVLIECKEAVKRGGKATAKKEFPLGIQDFQRENKFGGGGLNSARVLAKYDDCKVVYMDISTPGYNTQNPGKSLCEELLAEGIESKFISARPIPLNLILGDKDNKIIIKSPIEKTEFAGAVDQEVREFLLKYSFSNILMNSVKDEGLAELLSLEDNALAVVTKSLNPDFVQSIMLQRCVCVFNFGEFGYIMGHEGAGDENSGIEIAIEDLERLRMDVKPKYPVFVTLGKNGVLVADEKKTQHVMLNPIYSPQVQNHVEQNPAKLCGAGDAFSAYALLGLKKGLSSIETAVVACLGAVNYLGYFKLTPSAFNVGECINGKDAMLYFDRIPVKVYEKLS